MTTTTRRLLVSAVVLGLLSVFACTDSEQQKMIERNKRIEEQNQAQQPPAEAQPDQQPTQQAPEPEQTPETPPEPEKVTVYKVDFTLQGRNNTLVCSDINREACGYDLKGCNDGYEYRCITNMRFKEEQIDKPAEDTSNETPSSDS